MTRASPTPSPEFLGRASGQPSASPTPPASPDVQGAGPSDPGRSPESVGPLAPLLSSPGQHAPYPRVPPSAAPPSPATSAASPTPRAAGGSPAADPACAGASDTDDDDKRGFFAHLFKPLRDFGLGRASLLQGGVGLFVVTGLGMALALASWARSGRLGRRGRGYQAMLEFPEACGLGVGVPVHIRGVAVGGVLAVRPSLTHVDVLVEITDPTTVIPRDSEILANQSGLLAEPRIDITPRVPVRPYRANPLDPGCEEEGSVVCHRGRIAGARGVAADDLIAAATRLAGALEGAGVDRLFAAMDAAQAALERSTPLLVRAGRLADAALPLLDQLTRSDLLGAAARLASAAADAAGDARSLQASVLTGPNVEALRDGVASLARTLQHVERVAGDVGKLTADRRVAADLRRLIEALSRISSE